MGLLHLAAQPAGHIQAGILMKMTVVLSTLCALVMAVLLIADGSLAQRKAPLVSAEDLAGRRFGPLAKAGGDLADVYDEHQTYLQKGGFAILQEAFKPTNRIVWVIDDPVVIDATAEGDPEALLARTETVGAAFYGLTPEFGTDPPLQLK